MAIDDVANHLLPIRGGQRRPPRALHQDDEEEKDVDVDCNETENDPHCHREAELNDYFSCNVETRIVRDVAPGKVVVCVSFTATPKLVRHMQGDYT